MVTSFQSIDSSEGCNFQSVRGKRCMKRKLTSIFQIKKEAHYELPFLFISTLLRNPKKIKLSFYHKETIVV